MTARRALRRWLLARLTDLALALMPLGDRAAGIDHAAP